MYVVCLVRPCFMPTDRRCVRLESLKLNFDIPVDVTKKKSALAAHLQPPNAPTPKPSLREGSRAL